jgi:outer membrane protein OmpA-like peptidoglycan-associated protein
MKHLFSAKPIVALLLVCFSLSSSAIGFYSFPPDSASKAEKAAKSSTKTPKDNQNQVQYLQKDLQQEDFNLNDRKAVNKPQMPHYDLPADSAVYMGGRSRSKQQDAFINHKYYYPAKPKNQWEIGLGVGSFLVSGDVTPVGNPLKSYGATFTIRKSFGYVFSLRGQYVFGHAEGLDYKPKANSLRNPVLNGGLFSNINYTNQSILPNYRMLSHEASLEGVFTMGNLKFHRERTLVNLYAFLGVGAQFYKTMTNVLDANGNMYNYDEANRLYSATTNSGTFLSNPKKKAVYSELKNMMDKTYETQAESHTNTNQTRSQIKSYAINPLYNIGVGLGFHVSKRVTINLESRVSITGDDLLDGQRFQDDQSVSGGAGIIGGALTRNYDTYYFNAVTVNIHLGKKALEPLWWLNPMDYTYKKLGEMDPDRIIAELLQDDDEDGIINKLDKEPATKKGCPVDTHGVALDSDKDGIIDCDDKEPFSPPGFPIDANGVAKVPCCAEGMKGQEGTGKGFDCSKVELPSIYFGDDKYNVSPEYFAHLHEVADKLQMCPDAKIVVTGINVNGKYGEQLSWSRVNKAIDYMTSKYGVSRDRFIVKFVTGEKATTPQQKMEQRRVEFRVAQDGETGPSNPPAPHPGLKAGKDF